MDAFAARIDEKAKSGTVSNWETGKNLVHHQKMGLTKSTPGF